MPIYLAGPMSDYPQFNYPLFNAVTRIWRSRGYEILNPAENFGGDTTREYREYMREDLAMLLQADAIALLPGWHESKGAKFELAVAQKLGLKILDATTMELYPHIPTVDLVLAYS